MEECKDRKEKERIEEKKSGKKGSNGERKQE